MSDSLKNTLPYEIWDTNYRAPGELDVKDTWARWASSGAAVEAPEIRSKIEADFLWLFSGYKGMPGGRIMANLGVDGRMATTLFNCVGGETLVQTKEGPKPAGSLKGEVQTRSLDGVWRTSTWGSYGEQLLYRVTFEDGTVVRATAGHRWEIYDRNSRTRTTKVATTLDLVGARIPIVGSRVNIVQDNNEFEDGIRHGIVYGDGFYNKIQKYCVVDLFGTKKPLAARYFPLHSYYPSRDCFQARGLPEHYKALPEFTKSIDYLRGFVAGLIATDGHIDKRGVCYISSSKHDHLEVLRQIFAQAGCPTGGIRILRKVSNLGDQYGPNYGFNPYRATLSPELFLREDQYKRFMDAKKPTRLYGLAKVISVVPDKVEEVFCCEEPETQTWALADGKITKNCFVSSASDIPGEGNIDSIGGIFRQLERQAHTLKSEGGYGHNFSYIRPSGAYVQGIGSSTPGVVAFMGLWNESSRIITQGSTKQIGKRNKLTKKKIRKGAMMGVLDVWHPDIREFITAKQNPGVLDKFNVSTGITEGFMTAVVNDLDWELRFPDTTFEKYDSEWFGNIIEWEQKGYPVIVYETVKAKEIWDLITYSTYTRNEPGIMFLDVANDLNPLQYGENVKTSNPCQPAWAPVLTPGGLSTIGEIQIGDKIWSKQGWTTVVNKWSSGVKDVYEYRSSAATFYGTDKHRVVDRGIKTEVGKAKTFDVFAANGAQGSYIMRAQDAMDGLALGNGVFHSGAQGGASITGLCISKKNQDLFQSGIKDLIFNTKPKLNSSGTTHLASSTLTTEELPIAHQRVIPARFKKDFSTMSGFLRGLFSANGGVSAHKITLKHTSKELVYDAQVMLSALGIMSSVAVVEKPTTIKFYNSTHTCKQSYVLSINIASDAQIFAQRVGFLQQHLMDKLQEIVCKGKDESNYDIQATRLVSNEEVFDLTVDNESHTYWSGGVDTSNCGEIIMSTGVCNLLSVNLAKFFVRNVGGQPAFDMENFKKAIAIGVRFSDNINDISRVPLDEYGVSVKEKRRIGMGVLGLGSLHMILGIRYGSPKSLELIQAIFQAKAETELLTSARLGREKGSFGLFDKEKYFSSKWWNGLRISKSVRDEVLTIGEMRNSHRSANAPTGNMGIFAEVTSGGIEPVFMKSYTRWSTVIEEERSRLQAEGFQFPDPYKGEWYETQDVKFAMRGDEQILRGSFKGQQFEVDKGRGLVVANDVVDYGWRVALSIYSEDELINMDEQGVFDTTDKLSVEDHIRPLEIIAHYTDMNSSKCIAKGTKVQTNKGNRAIEDLGSARGEDVFGEALKDLQVMDMNGEWKNVTAHYSNGVDITKIITLSSGATVECSLNHMLLTANGWVKSSELSVRDKVFQRSHDQEKFLVEISEIKEGSAELYDIEVEDNHSYLLENGIVSHNTINLPAEYQYTDFQKVYMDAWKAGIKGVTTYRAGTMTAVLEAKKEKVEEEQEKVEEAMSVQGVIQEDVKLPTEFVSKGYIIKPWDEGVRKKWYVNIAFSDESMNKPFAIFVNTNNKEGYEVTGHTITDLMTLAQNSGIKQELVDDQVLKMAHQSNVIKIARALGFLLRHNVPLEEIVAVLDKGNYPLSSFTFHIKRLLKQFIPDGVAVQGKKCSACGSEKMVMQEGCYVCMDCGSSKCG